MQQDDAQKKIEIFYDGQCPMCMALMDKVTSSSQKEHFQLRDMHADTNLPFSSEAIGKEIHVRDSKGTVYTGAEAILAILRQYPRLQFLSRIGNWALIKPLLPVGYALISKNRRFLFGPASTIFYLKIITVLGFISGILLSLHLWAGSRIYPLVPILKELPSLAYPYEILSLALLCASAISILVSSRPQKYIWGFVSLIIFLCVFDQMRWQPWVYQYSWILVALALFSWDSADVRGQAKALNVVRLIVASTYIYSGLQKVNIYFISGLFPWLVEPITRALPMVTTPLYLLGVFAPFLQIAFGIGLLTKRYRKISLIAAVLMHLFILLMIGPFGHNWNSIVWPWTTIMIIFDLLLFSSSGTFTFREVLWPGKSIYHALVLLFFGVLPLFSFFNLWDSYLSSALYSGNVTDAKIYVTEKGKADLPPEIARHLVPASPEKSVLPITEWSLNTLNVPPYPETRVYRQVAKQICLFVQDPSQIQVVIQEARMFRSNTQTTYHCSSL